MLYGHQGREAHLRAVFDVVSFVEAEVTKVVGRRPFAGSARLWGQGQVGEMVRQGAQAICDVVEGAVRRGALEEVVVQRLRKGEEKSHSGSDALGSLQNAKRYLIFRGQMLQHEALNIYFISCPRGLFQKRIGATFGVKIGSRGTCFSHNPLEKKKCLKFLSDHFKRDSNPPSFCRLADVYSYWQKNVDSVAGTFPGCIPSSHLM